MAHTYLIINIGSSSKKYTLLREGVRVYDAHFERSKDQYILTERGTEVHPAEEIPPAVFERSLEHVLLEVEDVLGEASGVDAVLMRVVALGAFFQKHALIDASYKSALSQVERLDPIHISPVLDELDRVSSLGLDIPIYAISDSAFHQTLPEVARRYALPRSVADTYDFFRFGYHGISVASAVRMTAETMGYMPERMIVCHLGSGASITAVRKGESIDTSMGYSPLEGLLMSTRSGDIDPAIVMRLAREQGIEKTETMLYRDSGLKGLSERSDDMKALLEQSAGDLHARETVDAFVYRAQKYIGAYYAVLDGLDALVFTGTMGERSTPIRAKIASGLMNMGILLDVGKNSFESTDQCRAIHYEMHTPVYVVHSDEATEMARITDGLIGASIIETK